MPKNLFQPGTPKPPNSGRKKGQGTRLTVRAIVDATGKDPSEVLAELMNDPKGEPRLRAHCAGELMKYLYPSLRAVEVTGVAGGPIEGRTLLEVVYTDKSVPE